MLLPTLLAGLMLLGAGVGEQPVDTPQAGQPSAAARTTPPPSVPAPTTEQATANDPNKVTCRYEREPNSMFSSRTCHTSAQWAEIAKEAREFVNGTSGHFGCNKSSC